MEKRKRGRPSLNGAKITFTIPGALLKRLDEFAAAEQFAEQPNRADAIRILLGLGLESWQPSPPARSGEGRGQ
jgi:hypothetical protein